MPTLQVVHFLLFNSASPVCAVTYFWICDLPLAWKSIRFFSPPVFMRSWFPPLNSQQLPTAPELGVRLQAYLPSPWWNWSGSSLNFLHRSCVHAVKTSVSSFVQLPCVRKTSFPHKYIAFLLMFFLPLLQWPLTLGKKEYDVDVPFRAEHSATSYSLYFGQLWVSLLLNF